MSGDGSPPGDTYRANSHPGPPPPPARSRWQRFVDWALKREPPIPARRTETEILAFARAYLEPLEEWVPEVAAHLRREEGRIVWYLVTNTPNRGAHTQLTIDDETLEILRHHFVPL